jgi:hypothetical protein
MGDYKYQYTTNVNKVKKAAEHSKAISKKLNEGQSRATKFKSNWPSVNVNDVVEQYAPGAARYESNGKIIFSNGGSYVIVTDVAGGYLRIQDTSLPGSVYVTIDGRYQKDFKSIKEFNKHSHYRILKREEM